MVYSDNVTDPSFYESASRHKAKNIDYTGFYYFGLPHDNSLTAQLSYSYSHTDQSSGYAETDLAPILNSANDDTHSGDARLTYSHTLNKEHSIMTYILGLYEHSRTDYDGSVEALDNSTTKYGQLSASYSFRREAFSASLGLGWSFLSTSLNSKDAFSNYPYVDVSLGYRPEPKSSVGIDFHHSTWPPSQNYKSANLIHVSPFMWHTGNPLLKAYKSYDISAYYTFLPSKKLRMSAYTGAWFDIAREKYGASWRLPTAAEFEELIERCKWEWEEAGDSASFMAGYRVTGPNGKSIFLPAAGHGRGTVREEAYVTDQDIYGAYWSGTLGEDKGRAFELFFHKENISTDEEWRSRGNSIRPVCPR